MSKLKGRLMILSAMLLAIAALAGLTAGSASAVSPGGRDTAVIMFNFNDDTSQPATTTQLRQWLFTNTDSLNAWLREDSGNTVWLEGRNNTNGDFFGWVTINANNNPDPVRGCITPEQVDSWRAAARARAATLGYVQANYAHTIFVQPGFSGLCNGEYKAFAEWTTGDLFYNDDYRADAIGPILMHELSHALPPGNHHAHKITCNYMGYGVPIDDGGSCTQINNGDWFSTVGSNAFYTLNNGYVAARLGYIPPANVQTVSSAATTNVTLRPAHPNVSGATQLIRIDRGAAVTADYRYLYLDYRQPTGVFDAHLPSSITNGVFARVARDHGTIPDNSFTYLIDATPWTTASNAWDDTIKVGDPLYDRVGNLSVTVNSVSSTSASVTVSPGAPASQGTVSLSGNQLRFVAAAGKRNIIGTTYDSAAGQINVRSPYATGGRLTAGAGCTAVSQIHVRCPSAGVTRQYYDLGDRDDQLTAIPAFAAEIRGGDGNDTLNGSTAGDTIYGGAGSDELTAGSGNDTIQPGTGNDNLHGGAGIDTADYADRTANVYITNTGTTTSGESGESDRIDADIENLTGGAGNDSLIGNASANTLRGNLGADSFDGAGGTDLVTYSERTTAVWSSINGAADDGAVFEGDNIQTTVENLLGGSSDDILIGSESIGNMIDGGLGVDVLNGLSGNDTLGARDRVNDSTLDCGAGTDILLADPSPSDALTAGCETISRL